jgi:hypothetical protein
MLPGCRPSEARALRVGNVNLELGQVFGECLPAPEEGGRGRGGTPSRFTRNSLPGSGQATPGPSRAPGCFRIPWTGAEYAESALKRVWDNVRKAAGVIREGGPIQCGGPSHHSVVAILRASRGRSDRYPAMDRVWPPREFRPHPGEEEGHEEAMATIRKLPSLEALRRIGLP